MMEKFNETASIRPTTKFNKKTFRKIGEAPVFYPTVQEFADPISFFEKIRPDVEKIGICKIIPPSNWQPSFALDVEKFKFVPRVQCLNELEASTRIKINFLNQLATFWEMQGSKLKVPSVEQKALDLYELRKLVQKNGGYCVVTSSKKWDSIATKMEYPPGKCGYVLKSHYHKILCPFDDFEENNKANKIDNNGNRDGSSKLEVEETLNYKQQENLENGVLFESKHGKSCKELQRLQFYGAGPKMAGFIRPPKSRKRKIISTDDSFSNYSCKFCKKIDYEETILLCARCEASFHLYCLKPPLLRVPEGEWCCAECIENEIKKNMEPFGFSQAEREYTLQEFGEKAEKFKLEYFNMPIDQISSEMIENEYWNILSSVNSKVTVEYGADLHTTDHGSAFPTKKSINLDGEDADYAKSPWNLNNISVIEGSILNYLAGDISGIKLPWMYVGMLFSTFCWHNEDHWTYSINYLHWGEAKTWYGVSGEYADKFEQTMESVAPELFKEQPDLLQLLITQMNPHILIEAGVPVHRTDQHPGEFVVTFPRAYHTGFNQGYNFAEAVNFAPAEWLKMGRECVKFYSHYRRCCVFSHDELVCKMATNSEKLSLKIAAVTYEDLLKMTEMEKNFRKKLLEWGVNQSERVLFELISDENRQCSICNTTCFLSAMTCKCNLKQLACFRHFKRLCKCPPSDHILQYRYTLDELIPLLRRVRSKAESFDRWMDRVRDVLVDKKSISFNELKTLYFEAITKKFPSCNLLDLLKKKVFEKCIDYTDRVDTSSSQLTLKKWKFLSNGLIQMCSLQEVDVLNKRIFDAEKFKNTAATILSKNCYENNIVELENCINFGISLKVEFKILTKLKYRLHNVRWFKEIEKQINSGVKMSMDNLQFYIQYGLNLEKNEFNLKVIKKLKSFLSFSLNWEKRAKVCLESNSQKSFATLSSEMKLLLVDAQKTPVELPSHCILQDTYKMVMDWYTLVSNAIQCLKSFNYTKFNFVTLEKIVKYADNLPIKFTETEKLRRDFKEACDWKKRVFDLFAKDASMTINQLADLICPRYFELFSLITTGPKIVTADNIVNSYNRAQRSEIEKIKKIQKINMNNISNRLHTSKFCICNRSKFGQMIKCVLCKNLFHIKCIKNDKQYFLCCICQRTKRPTMASVQELLNDLQKIDVHLDEGVMLKCLIRRALQWKERAEHITKNGLSPNNYSICGSLLSNLLLEGELLEVSDFKNSIMAFRNFMALRTRDQNVYTFDEVVDLTIDDEDDATGNNSSVAFSEYA